MIFRKVGFFRFMKKRHFALCAAIMLCALLVACAGAYLKYHILKPMDLYQDKNIFELPFLMYGDEYLRFLVENAEEMRQMEQTTSPTKPSSNATTGTTEGTSGTTTGQTNTTQDTTVLPPDTSSTDVPSTSGATDSTQSTDTTQTTQSTQTTQTTTTTSSTTRPPETTTTAGPNFDFPYGVDDAWFDNVLFIGDSRVVGLREYARSGNADYFCDVGMHLLSYDDKELSDKNFSTQSLESLLSSRQYDKIIVNFGLNECGFNDYSFKMLYTNLVDMLRRKQPDAIIIVQGIMSVTRNKAATADYFHPSFIAARSAFIASLADNEHVFYIDCNPYFADSEGYLYSSLTNDGYHPTVTGYRYWRDWIAFALYELGL